MRRLGRSPAKVGRAHSPPLAAGGSFLVETGLEHGACWFISNSLCPWAAVVQWATEIYPHIQSYPIASMEASGWATLGPPKILGGREERTVIS